MQTIMKPSTSIYLPTIRNSTRIFVCCHLEITNRFLDQVTGHSLCCWCPLLTPRYTPQEMLHEAQPPYKLRTEHLQSFSSGSAASRRGPLKLRPWSRSSTGSAVSYRGLGPKEFPASSTILTVLSTQAMLRRAASAGRQELGRPQYPNRH